MFDLVFANLSIHYFSDFDTKNLINELKEMNYDKMIVGCLSHNPSNDFYKHMSGKFIDTNPFTLPNGQKLIENLYYYEI